MGLPEYAEPMEWLLTSYRWLCMSSHAVSSRLESAHCSTEGQFHPAEAVACCSTGCRPADAGSLAKGPAL